MKLLPAPLAAAAFALAVALPLPALAQAAAAPPPQSAQKLLPAQSEIAFTSRQMGVPVEGKFRKFDARVAFDPKNPQAARIDFTVDLGSAWLGSAESEAELVKPLWFDTARFPQARFTSTTVKPLGADRFEVAGRLTIKNQTRDVVVPVTLAPGSGGATVASGSFTLKRLEFRIGENEWADTSMVANDVQVRLKLALAGVPAR
ncbi:YceI family protein [Caldimonas tepidiphila]|uniref:YceI family protein n=1 Tax=Caldimonas tepidiphila TaxID=2315841 RepID=UPI000E5C2E56|nr:YceI family protein [Caldimonas tepidiphila]